MKATSTLSQANKSGNRTASLLGKCVMLFSIALCALIPAGTRAQQVVTVGTGTSTTYNTPVNNYYNYTYSQILYMANELQAGTISTIGFQYSYSTSMTSKTSVKIYMGTTNTSSFSSASEYITSGLTQVYSGSLNCSQGWNTFNLQTPYNYSGNGNLLVVIVDNSGSYNSSSYTFYGTSISNKVITYYSDSYAPSGTSPNASMSSSVQSVRPNTRFTITPACPSITAPVDGSTVSASSVTATWGAMSGVTGYHIYLSNSPQRPSQYSYSTTSTSQVVSGIRYGVNYLWVIPYTVSTESSSCEDNYVSFTRSCPGTVTAPTITADVDLNHLTCGQTVTLTANGEYSNYYWYSDAGCTNQVGEGVNYSFSAGDNPISVYCKSACIGSAGGEVNTDFNYTGGQQSFTVPAGITSLTLEVWGAQGGYRSSSTYGGKGGYSIGTAAVTPGQTLYVNVGGSGNTGGTSGGYNGGGSRTTYNGGGGATHIATRSGVLSSLSSYQSTVLIVAGGGGSCGASTKNGMYGGGTTGGSATQSYGSGGGGGTQAAGGTGGSGNAGSFGQGGAGLYRSSGYGGAGGGGWYGGGGAYPDGSGDDDRGGGGGSGYIGGVTGGQTIAGNLTMPNPSGGTMTGREGNGYARITYQTPPQITYSSAASITAGSAPAPGRPTVEVANACPGEDVTLTVTNAVPGLTYGWWDNSSCSGSPLFEGNSYTIYNIQNSGTYYVRAYSGTMFPVYDFSYTGSAQSLTVPGGVSSVTLEVWGAQGGGQQTNGNTGAGYGGNGGYSVGTMSVSGGEILYVYVGGEGQESSALAYGGFNGGGTNYGSGSGEPACGGGGATDIRLNGNTLYDRIIVAGGGGGGGEDSGDQGGYGGGTSGGAGNVYSYQGTQTSAGTGAVFGIGASAGNDGGGGGGGWYGGGTYGGSQTIPSSGSGSDCNGGSGGSGYVWTSATSSYAPSGYRVPTSYYLSNAQTIAGNVSFPAPNGGNETGHAGNGYARITFNDANPLCQSPICTVPVNLYQAPSFTLSADVQTSCNQAPVTLSITGASADIIRYEWSDGTTTTSTSRVVTPGQTTTYTVTAYNSGCGTSHSIQITVDAPEVTLSGTDNGNCVEPGSEITLSVNGGVDGEVVVGSMESTDAYLPLLSCYNYNSSEQIYLPSEIGGAGYITSISFYMTSWVRNGTGIRLFMRNTNKNSFSSTSDWVTMTNADLVASNVSFPSSSTTGWQTITLDQPFYYDGTSNLLVGLDADYQSYSCSNNYYYYTTGAYRSLTFWDDNYSCFLTSPIDASDILSYNAYARFNIVANANYDWSNGLTDREIAVAPNETTTYTVTVTDDGHVCPAILEYTVHVKPDLVVLPENPMVCPGGTVTLTASGADSYAWSNGVTSAAQTVGAGSYTVTGTNADGCYVVKNVTVTSLSIPSAGEIATMQVCQSDYEITLASNAPADGGGNVEYRWTIGSITTGWSQNPEYTLTDANRTTLGTGTVNVSREFRDDCGNTGSATGTLTINPPMAAPTVQGVNTLFCGQNTTLTASTSVQGNIVYRWYSDPEGQNLVYEGSEFVTPALDATTTYYVQTVEVPLVNVPYDFTYTGSVQSWPVPAGVTEVQLEVWGAQGGRGSYNTYTGGLGGYSVATLGNLNGVNSLNVYVGGAGTTSTTAGWNGGGAGVNSGGGGGGATDIRVNGNTLYDRIIVAGGGGGAGVSVGSANPAGCGGGLYGGDGYYNYTDGTSVTTNYRSGSGATQTQGGTCWTNGGSYTPSTPTTGSFGQGGNASDYSCGGGGGGWYGGGGAFDNDSDSDGRYGGGGSGYVWTAATASSAPSGYNVSASYYLTNAQTIAGNTSFPAPNGIAETGHTGNGHARITVTAMEMAAENCPSELVPFTITVNRMPAPTVEVRSACIGEPSELVVTNPVEGYQYQWSADPDFSEIEYIGTTFTPTVNQQTRYYVRSVASVTSEPIDFDYTGDVQSYHVPAGVSSVLLEVWGAEGGSQTAYSGSFYAGRGGYSVGKLNVTSGDVLNVYVGGKGENGGSGSIASTQGGWNGGGMSSANTTSSYFHAGGGGGGTDVRINSTSLYARVIVAGGAGGAAYGASSGTVCGGNGGGLSGTRGTSGSGYETRMGFPGTQTAGGTAGTYTSGSGTAGTFGIGGTGGSGDASGGGGGGGWYGGGGGNYGSASAGCGAGGSGYVYTASTASSYPSGCLLNSSRYLTDAQTIAGDQQFLAPDGTTETGHTGNGFARITLLEMATDYCPSVVAEVVLDPQPAPSFTLTASANAYCAGSDAVVLTIQNPSADIESYEWSDGTTSSELTHEVTPGHTTTYTVTASNTSCGVAQSVTITVDAPDVTLSGTDNGACIEAGTEVTITIEGGGMSGEISVGTMDGTDNVLPLNSCYNYNSSESIYTPAEIGGAGWITSISYYIDSWTRNGEGVNVYMKNTNKSSFSSTSDWVTMTAADRVASNITFPYSSTTGWQTITLPQPFYYDGTSNLLIGLDADYQSYSCSNTYYTYTTNQSRALGYWNDSYSCFLTSPTTANDIYTYNACIRIEMSSAYDYAWSTGSTEHTITVIPNETTTYTVTVSDDDHACPAILDYTVRVNPTVEIAPENPMICPNGDITLTASGADTYFWNTGEHTADITVGAGTYSVTGTNNDGCSANATITVNELAAPSAGEIANMNVCQSDYEITLASNAPAVGGGNVEYRWTIGSIITDWSENLVTYTLSAQERETLGTNTYNVTREYRDGCNNSGSATATLTINPPMTAPLITGNTEVACGSNTTLTAAGYNGSDYIYRWYADEACTQLLAEGADFVTPSIISDTTIYVQVEHISMQTETHTFNYTGSEQVLAIPSDAITAELSVYGAQGGSGCSSSPSYYPGGLGGYMSGTVDLTGISQLYVNVGGQGESALMQMVSYPALQGGYNGGGNTGIHDNTSYYNQGGAGGGATHIATRSGVLSSLEAYQSDVLIVAGGGGGAGGQDSYAGNGGGLSGTAASSSTDYYGQGGSQSSGGSGATGTYPAASGSFGQGGNGGSNSGVTGGAGGGGGWYGGGGGRSGNSFSCYGGGGGSGYLSPALTSTSEMTGVRSGNGYAEITITRYQRLSCPTEAIPIHLTVVDPETPVVEVSACVGLPATLTVSNPINGYSYIWSTDPEGNNPVDTAITFSPTLDGPATYYVRGAVISQPVTDFAYTGSVQTYTVPAGVSRLRLEVWGAQGGTAPGNTEGGRGGYSVGEMNVTSGTTLNVYVGGQGGYGTNVTGGFNGGGNGFSSNSRTMTSGGGATDIRVNSTSLYSRVIVAGGGGGGYETGVSGNGSTGSYGGGSNGGTGQGYSSERFGQGATQTLGGATATDLSWGGTLYAGTFGVGGYSVGAGYSNGGGGGWYGGGPSSPDGGAGGGSGYVYTSSSASNYPAGCLLNSNYYLGNAQTIAGSTSFPAPEGGDETGHTGNGFARITVVGTSDILCGTEVTLVSVTPFPSPSVTLSASSTEACNQEEVELTFTASSDVLSYQFSSGVEERDGHYYVQPGVTTTYTVSVSNEGCTVTDEVTIHVAAPEVELLVSDQTQCLENGAELTLEVVANGGGIAQNAASYMFNARTETFQSFSDGTSCSTGDDAYTYNVPIGFTFNYSGLDFTTIGLVSSNGVIQLQNSGASYSNSLGSSSYYHMISPFWDDLYANSLRYKTTGTAPNRVFQLQFDGYQLSYDSYLISYQIKLYEGSNAIEFCYGSSGYSSLGSGATASIGLNSYVNNAFSFLSVTPTAAGVATTSSVSANDNVPGSAYLQNTVYRFTPTPPLTYYWNTGDETESITVNPTEDQTYTVTVSSADYNCDAVLSYDVHVIPNVTVSATPEFICEGDEAVLTASGADTYSWTSGETDAIVTKPVGIYAVTGTTEAGCSAMGSYSVETVSFTAGSIASDEITICASQTTPVNIASLVDGVTGGTPAYRWYCNGELINGANESSYLVTVSEMTEHNGGDFTYTREYLNGCTGSWEASAGSYIIHQTPAVSLTVEGITQVECGTGTTLTASGYTGSDVMYKWYADENCTQLVHTGATFNVENVTEDVTYYVQAASTIENTQTQDFSYTGAVQTYTVPAGTESLVLECWGAQGGDATYGGKGGYSVGELNNLNGITNLYVYVGEQPSSTTGGWNGGGGYTSYGTSGGGATDISLHNNTYNTSAHYNDRIIVAGGGGGKGFSTGDNIYGGYGGGLNGGTGGAGSASSGGSGASQTVGGSGGVNSSNTSYAGVFGTASTSIDHNGGGGGGGWYGGGSGVGAGTDAAGGGGSGFVWTGQNTVPASYAVSIGYALANASTVAGNQSMPNPLGGTMTGRSGSGYARITANIHVEFGCASLVTPVTITKLPPVAPEVTASSTQVVCGTTTTMTVQNPNDELLYQWSTDPDFGTILHTGTEYTPVVGGEVTYYVRSIPLNVVVGPQDFSYTGAEQTYTVPDGITEVLLEVWGAQGGQGGTINMGGAGGYSTGTLQVNSGDLLYVYVGGQGEGSTGTNLSGVCAGGYNGGGIGYSGDNGVRGGGGGATHIAIASGLLEDLSSNQSAVKIVAGGGGGNMFFSDDSHIYTAGAGGGLSGTDGSNASYGYGGTQNEGGLGYSSFVAAGFGYGGYYGASSSGTICGGGAGWYGGGSGNPGGGGSGYIGGVTDAQTIAGNESFPAPDGTTEIGHSGNGFARITPLGTATSNCISANASITITTTEPEPVQIEDVTVGCGAPATLTISNAVPGLYYDWYADAECTQLVHQGTSWTLPEVGSNTTYYIRSYGLNQVPGTVMMDSVISYSGSSFEFMVPPAVSEVTLQLWGAQGGNVYYGANQSITQYGGKGGYAAGTLAVDEGDVLYFNVGGQGGNGTSGATNVAIPGGFNGGGNGGAATTSSANYYPGAGGGGATDVRFGSNNISDRILVAGGGGGAAYHATASSMTGGYGGGAAGTDGYTYISGRNGKGATASTSGAAGTDASYANGMAGTTSVNGGVGGNGGNGYSGGAGGGGGYHGGGGGAAGNPESGAGGGGNGYCSSELTHTANLAGNVRMPSPTGGYTTGRSGDGIAIISYVRPVFDTLCVTTPKAVNITIEPLPTPTVADQTILCGTPVTLAVTDQDASSYTYIWYADVNCTQEVHRGVTFEVDGSSNISADTVYYVKAYRGLLASSQQGSQGFSYNNDVQVFEIPANATRLTMEVWGADGGNMDENHGDTLGGIGGYSVGTLNNLQGLDALYVYVGGRGNGSNGGFNGGQSASASVGGGGGGASDISFVQAAVNSAEHYNSRLIVAGGGGGSGFMNANRQVAGGYGGGLAGGQGGNGTTGQATVTGGNGGSQTTAGHNDGQNNMIGAFGTANTAVSTYGGGGGGGWYGGASGAGESINGGGGGGSGFVWNSASRDYTPASYTVGTEYYLNNASTTAGNENTLPAKPVDTHNGYVLIHYYFPEIYLCESEAAEVHIRTSPIQAPDFAYAVDEDNNEVDAICSGDDIMLVATAAASASDPEGELPMILWFDASDEFVGASNSGEVLYVTPEQYGSSATEAYFVAYAATDLISMSGSYSLHTTEPVVSGNGRDNVGKGVFVDMTASANLTVDTLCFYPGYTGSSNTTIYYRRGSCAATSTSSQGWNIAYSGSSEQTQGVLCSVPLSVPVDIASGETFSFYVVNDNDLYYRPYGVSTNNTAGIHFGDALSEYRTSAMNIHANYGTASNVAAFSTQHGNYHFIGDIYYTLTGEVQFGCVSDGNYDIYLDIYNPSSVENMRIEAPDSIICLGDEVQLTAMYGSQGYGAKYVWTAGSCDGTVISQGTTDAYSSITVAPTVTTTYYVKFESDVCGATECVAKTIYVLNPAEVAAINTPAPICALGELNIDAPSFSTDLEQLGVAVDARGWQCSEDGVNFVEFTDSLAISESYNGWWVRYYVTTRCATGYSNAVQITVDSLPVVAALTQPDPMCSPTTFDWDSYIPTVNLHNNSDADVVATWHVMIDGAEVAFDPAREFSYGHDVKAWYSVQNGCGTVTSDTMTLVFWQAPYAENITALNGAVCAGQPLAVLPPVTHEFGGTIEQGWEYTRTYGSDLYHRFPSDTIIDYGMNHTFVRYYIGNECGSMHTNFVELVVNDIPTLGELTYAGGTYCSGDDFDLETPEVLATGDIQSLGAGWYLSADSALNSDNQLISVDVNAGIDADLWNGQWLRYADTNACGVGFSNAVQVAVYPSHHLVVTPDYDTACFGPTYTITALSDYADASFSWEGDGLNETTGAQVTVSPADPGDWTYTVTATEPTHGCQATAVSSFHLNLISKDTSIHICASDLNYVFDPVGHPEIVCTQSGFFTYEYVTSSGCDSVVYLTLDVTYPIDRTTRIHYCNHPVQPYVWPVSGESLIDENMADTVIYRTQVVPCANITSDLDGHICDSIVYSLELTISNEPYLEVPVTNVVMPVNQTATAAFNVRKDCDFPGAKMAVAFNLYKDDTLIDIMSDYGTVSMSTYMPEVDRQFGSEVRIGTGELPGNTFSLYNYDYNYFYADYFCSLDNFVTASWNQPGEYKLELVVIGKDGGMDYAYTDDNQQVMGGAGSYTNGRVYADTSYIYFHVGSVDTMAVTDTVVCDSDLPFYVYGVEVSGPGYYEAFAGNEGNYQMYPYNVTVNTVHYDEFTVTLSDDCDSYVWNGRTCTRLGDYYDTVRYASGCDSLITTLHLRHGDAVVIDTNVMSCGAFDWAVNGQTYDESGNYSADGPFGDCTATYNLHLTVNTPYDTTINVTVAPMQLPYAYDDEHVFDAAGLYDIVYQCANGCDSTIHINLAEATTGFVFDSITIPADLGTTGQFDVNVTGGGLDNMKVAIDYEITRNGEILENVADYGYVYFSTDYADIHQTIGRELRTGTGSIPQSTFRVIYYQYTYWYLNFLNYTTNHLTARWDLPGEYKIKFYLRGREGGEDYALTFDQNNPQLVGGGGSTTIAGDLAVDSLVMHYNIDTVFMTLDTTICSNEVPFVYHGHEFTASTDEPQEIEFSDPYLVSDTVVTFTLTVNPAYNLFDTAYICQGGSYQDANFTLTADTIAQKTRWRNGEGKAVFTLDTTTVAGCDSIVTLTLYVLPLPNFHISSPATSACVGVELDMAAVGNADRYLWYGDQLQQAVNDNQANEITGETLNVTVNESMTIYLTGYIDSLINPELTLTCSATDSIRITAVPLGDTTDYEAAVCQGEPYVDDIFTVSTSQTAQAGTYQFLVETGRTTCGIYIARLTLTVNPVYDSRFGYAEIEDVVCEGYPYQNNGFDLSADSVLTLRAMHQTQVYGDIVLYNYDETDFACDSITQLTLHVLPTVYADTTIHRCTSLLPYLYTENGQEFAVEGDTTVNVLYQQVDNGCDSIRRVAIVFDPMPVMEVLGTEICANAETGTLMLTYTNDNQANVDSIKWYINNDVVSTDDRLSLTMADFASDLAVEVYAGACVFTPNVTIDLIDNPEVAIDTTICEGVTYVAPDGHEIMQTTENYECYVADVNGGCDIHYVVNVTVNPVYDITETQTIRATQLPYVWNGITFEAAGTHTVYLTASTGCDSTVTMTLQLTDTLGGEPFMVTEQISDNEFSLTAFANRYNQDTKVAIAYSLYKDGNLVNNINAECGGDLYIATKWLNTYVGDEVASPEGYIPGNTFRMGVNYFDYFYFHFLNGRDNKLTHTFTEAGDYEIVFTLMSRDAGDDIYLTYTVNNETRLIGGEQSIDGVQLAIHSLTFSVEGADDEQQGDGTVPGVLVNNAATADVQSATSTVMVTYNGNSYNPDAMLAVNYVVLRDGEPLASVANVGDIHFSTYFPAFNSYVGDAIQQGSGNIFESTFNLMNMFRYNYFYLHFLQTTNSQLSATWYQPGEYKMVLTLVKMENGNDVGMTYNGSQNAGGQDAVSTNTVLSTATVNYHVNGTNNGAPEVQTGIADSDADGQLDLYPNPARDIVHVHCAVADAQLTVTDMNGKVVYALDGTHNGDIVMNVSSWSAGVYFVNLRNNETVVTKKLVVTR